MSTKRRVPGCIDLERNRRGEIYAVTRAEGNRAVLNITESVPRKRTILRNIEATARVYGGEVPLIRDFTGK